MILQIQKHQTIRCKVTQVQPQFIGELAGRPGDIALAVGGVADQLQSEKDPGSPLKHGNGEGAAHPPTAGDLLF